MFSIDGPTHFLLEPLKKFTTNIKCEKSRSTSVGKFFLHWLYTLYTGINLLEM